MMDSHTKGKAGKLCGILVFTLLIVLIPAVFFDFYYDLNDDTAIKDILSGTYTGVPSGYSIQMLFPLSWVIAAAYRAIPAFPWYGLFLCVCQFGVLVLIAWRLMGMMKRKLTGFAALGVLWLTALGLFIRELVIIQYSVTSGLCMVCAVFLFLTGKKTDKPSIFLKQNTIPVLLVILAFMIRTEMCMMLMPFLLLAGLAIWGSEERIFTGTNFRKYLMLIGSALLGILVALSLDSLAYGSSEWNSFRSFFHARTQLYDFYDLPPYDDENAEFYASIGLSRESYTLLENYNFALDESIDSWMLESIAEYQRQQAYEGNGLNFTFGYVTRNSPAEALWLYKNHLLSGIRALGSAFFRHDSNRTASLLSGEAVTGYAVIGVYAVYLLLCILPAHHRKKRQAFMKILALMVIRSILWLYLYMVDRAVDRVTTPLYMMELTVLIGFILNDYFPNLGENKQDKDYFFRSMTNTVFCILGLLFLTAAFWSNFNATVKEYQAKEAAEERWGALKSYCMSNQDKYYVIDVYSSTSYEGVPYSEKIFRNVDNSYRNFDICGGWVAKSPLYREKLAKLGLKDIQSALYAKKTTDAAGTYFVAACDKDLSWLGAYYERRGIGVEPVCVDTVYTAGEEPAFLVYELKARQSKN